VTDGFVVVGIGIEDYPAEPRESYHAAGVL
jgi:hypothetical protein